MTALWTSAEIAAATGGVASADFVTAGIAFDSREVGAGDLFVALAGEATDGHRFVDQAVAQGAAGAVVSSPVAAPHVLVADTAVALDALGAVARARMAGKVIGITGSAGKTGTKEALFAALDRIDPGIAHRSLKSYNNHVGVPLSLARMPRECEYGVFEMGMNHAGELSALTRLVRPDVAIITTIAPAHREFFVDDAAIADAKAEIFAGLEPGGTAIVPADSPHRVRLTAAARRYASQVLTFGTADDADVRALDTFAHSDGTTFVSLRLPDGELSFTLALPGAHWIANACAAVAGVWAAGGDPTIAGLALADMTGLPGRGERRRVALPDGEALVIDESYNANPASMEATLAVLGAQRAERRIAVLGEMRELGSGSAGYHEALAEPMHAANVDFALLVGADMAPLAQVLEGRIDLVHASDAVSARDALLPMLRAGDAILVKGSNGVGLSRVVAALTGGPLPR